MIENIGEKNTEIIYNGINQHEFSKIDKQQYKNQITIVGALYPRKKIDQTIIVYANLKKRKPEKKLKKQAARPERERQHQIKKTIKYSDCALDKTQYLYKIELRTNRLPDSSVYVICFIFREECGMI